MNEQQIREIVRDELTQMSIKFTSTPYRDDEGYQMVKLVGKLFRDEELHKATPSALVNANNQKR